MLNIKRHPSCCIPSPTTRQYVSSRPPQAPYDISPLIQRNNNRCHIGNDTVAIDESGPRARVINPVLVIVISLVSQPMFRDYYLRVVPDVKIIFRLFNALQRARQCEHQKVKFGTGRRKTSKDYICSLQRRAQHEYIPTIVSWLRMIVELIDVAQ